jgi:energy-converting hydrogenase Eha subunit H
VVVLLGVWNFGRAAALWRQLGWIEELPLVPEPRIRLMIAFVWGFLFLASAMALRSGLPQTRILLPLLLAAYGVYEFGIIALYSTERSAILLILSYGLMTLIASWVLIRPAARAYFQTD